MRKILYSPGFGAGWVSWHTGDPAQQKFMLEYPGFVEALQARDKRGALEPREFALAAAVDKATEALIEQRLTFSGWGSKREVLESVRRNEFDRFPIEIIEALPKFIQDWSDRFPGKDLPYLGGLRDLKIFEVQDNALVIIDEYDGAESVRLKDGDEPWL